MIEGFDENDEGMYYPKGALEELTEEEAATLVRWIKANHNDDIAQTIEPESLPFPTHIMGVGALPVGGCTDILMVGDAPDYDLPFKVRAFYDIEGCEFDETLRKARRKLQGFKVGDGKVEPWFVGEDDGFAKSAPS